MLFEKVSTLVKKFLVSFFYHPGYPTFFSTHFLYFTNTFQNYCIMTTVCGCVGTVLLTALPAGAGFSSVAPVVFSPQAQVKDVLEQTRRAEVIVRAHMHTFLEQAAERRAEITANFNELRNALDASERDALASFDGAVADLLKALRVQAEALEVKGYQISAHIEAELQFPLDFETEQLHFAQQILPPAVPIFNNDGLCIFRGALQAGKCWSFCFENDTVDQEQCRMLDELVEIVTKAKQEFGLDVFRKRAAVNHRHQSTPFQGKRLTALFVDATRRDIIRQFVVSPDGSMFGVMYASGHGVHLVSALTGAVIRSLIFKSPNGMCFAACGTNILVIDYAEDRSIQEVSVATGKHVRWLGLYTKYALVDANSQVVVAWGARGRVELYDYCSGNFIAFLGSTATYLDMKLTLDGGAVVVIDIKTDRLLIFAINGTYELVRSIETLVLPREIEFLSSTDVVVRGVIPGSSTSDVEVYSLNDFRHTSFPFPMPRDVCFCCAQGFVFVVDMHPQTIAGTLGRTIGMYW